VTIDPTNLAPVREFWARPIGHHSAELEAVLSILRAGPVAGKYCLIILEPHTTWTIGRISGVRGIAPAYGDAPVFHSIEVAERHIFRLRWQAATGSALHDEEALRA